MKQPTNIQIPFLNVKLLQQLRYNVPYHSRIIVSDVQHPHHGCDQGEQQHCETTREKLIQIRCSSHVPQCAGQRFAIH